MSIFNLEKIICESTRRTEIFHDSIIYPMCPFKTPTNIVECPNLGREYNYNKQVYGCHKVFDNTVRVNIYTIKDEYSSTKK